MSVESAAAFARAGLVGKAEHQARQATSTLSGFPVSHRVGAGAEALTLAERLLQAALDTIRSVRAELVIERAEDPAAEVVMMTVPGASGPAARAAVTPLSVRKASTGLDVVR